MFYETSKETRGEITCVCLSRREAYSRLSDGFSCRGKKYLLFLLLNSLFFVSHPHFEFFVLFVKCILSLLSPIVLPSSFYEIDNHILIPFTSSTKTKERLRVSCISLVVQELRTSCSPKLTVYSLSFEKNNLRLYFF